MEESAGYRWIMNKGRRRAFTWFIERLGHRRFGEPTKEIASVLAGIKDLDQLQDICVRLIDASSWDDLLPTP